MWIELDFEKVKTEGDARPASLSTTAITEPPPTEPPEAEPRPEPKDEAEEEQPEPPAPPDVAAL
eukprot:3375017-Prymnesium_polylepis.2